MLISFNVFHHHKRVTRALSGLYVAFRNDDESLLGSNSVYVAECLSSPDDFSSIYIRQLVKVSLNLFVAYNFNDETCKNISKQIVNLHMTKFESKLIFRQQFSSINCVNLHCNIYNY